MDASAARKWYTKRRLWTGQRVIPDDPQNSRRSSCRDVTVLKPPKNSKRKAKKCASNGFSTYCPPPSYTVDIGNVCWKESWVRNGVYICRQSEEWVVRGEISIPTVKQDLHPKKILIGAWLDQKGTEKRGAVSFQAVLHKWCNSAEMTRPTRSNRTASEYL